MTTDKEILKEWDKIVISINAEHNERNEFNLNTRLKETAIRLYRLAYEKGLLAFGSPASKEAYAKGQADLSEMLTSKEAYTAVKKLARENGNGWLYANWDMVIETALKAATASESAGGIVANKTEEATPHFR